MRLMPAMLPPPAQPWPCKLPQPPPSLFSQVCADNNRPGGTEEEYNEWSLFPNRCAFFNVSRLLGLFAAVCAEGMCVRAAACRDCGEAPATLRNAPRLFCHLWPCQCPTTAPWRWPQSVSAQAAQSQCCAPIPALLCSAPAPARTPPPTTTCPCAARAPPPATRCPS